jgi:hypothetical protein
MRAATSGVRVIGEIAWSCDKPAGWWLVLGADGLRAAPWRRAPARRPRAVDGLVARVVAHCRTRVALVVALGRDPRRPPGVFATRSADGGRLLIALAPGGGGRPTHAVKVALRGGMARAAASDLARASGRDHGVVVPDVLGAGEVAGRPSIVAGWVAGRTVAERVAGGRTSPGAVIARLGAWLAEWATASARNVLVTQELVDRRWRDPAKEMARELSDGAAYLGWIERRCAPLPGSTLRLVEAHHDLTMYNVLGDDADSLAILDWDTWDADALPLEDFSYAAADLRRLVAGTTRAEALEWTLGPAASAWRLPLLGDAILRAARADPATRELSLHACWLGHAVRERRRAGGDGARPFRDAMSRLVSRALEEQGG